MARSHLLALEKKRKQLDEKIHKEINHAACDELAIKKLKKQRLYLQEEIERISAH